MSIKQRIIFSNSIGFNLGCKKLRIIARKKITHSFIKRVVKQYAYKRVPEKIFQNERVLFKWRVFKLKFDEFWSDHQTKQQRNNYLENWQKNDILWKLYRWDSKLINLVCHSTKNLHLMPLKSEFNTKFALTLICYLFLTSSCPFYSLFEDWQRIRLNVIIFCVLIHKKHFIFKQQNLKW